MLILYSVIQSSRENIGEKAWEALLQLISHILKVLTCILQNSDESIWVMKLFCIAFSVRRQSDATNRSARCPRKVG